MSDESIDALNPAATDLAALPGTDAVTAPDRPSAAAPGSEESPASDGFDLGTFWQRLATAGPGDAVAATETADTVFTTTATGTAALAADTPEVNDAPSFVVTTATGAAGTLIQPVGSADDIANAITLQADGKLLIAGYGLNDSGTDFSVIRLNPDGSLDEDFGTAGSTLLSVAAGFDGAYALAVQDDGSILLLGSGDGSSNSDLAVARLNADGSLDSSFATSGARLLPVGSGDDFGSAVAVQADGRILLAGTSANGSSTDVCVVRLDAAGDLDASFGSGGKALVAVGSADDNGNALALQADQKILVAGSAFNGTNFDISVIRLTTSGALDTTFNGSGKVVLPLGSGDEFATSIAVQADGRIVLGGTTETASGFDYCLIRLTTSGALDTTFNGSGQLTVPLGSGDDLAYGLTLQSDGKILLAGQSLDASGAADFSVLRINSNGSLDSTFNGSGKLVLPVGSGDDSAYGVAVQADGRILLAGSVTGASDTDVGLVRLNANGSLDTTFHPATISSLGGTVAFTEDGAAVALDTRVDIDDPELAALDNYAGASLTLARQGAPDAHDLFGATGRLVFSGAQALLDGTAVAALIQASGSLVLTFNSNATQSAVDELLSSLTYRNSSDAPPASAVIGWTFSDGNTGSQGSGGAKTATGSVTVDISAVNDAPVAAPMDQTYLDDGATPFSLDLDDLIVDPDGTPLATLDVTAEGGLPSWLSYDATSHQLTGLAPVGTAATYTLHLSAADAEGATASTDITLGIGGVTRSGTADADVLTGYSGADQLDGAGGNDALTGQAGNDSLLGGDGDDTLDGGTGNDLLDGGAGDDVYWVDAPGDLLVELADGGADTLFTPIDFVLAPGVAVETLTLTGSASTLTGNELDNTLVGTDHDDTLAGAAGQDRLNAGGGNDRLDGGAGADTMAGGAGDDVYLVDDAGDLVLELSGEGADLLQASVDYVLAAGSEVETLLLVGSATSLTGNEGANRLVGGTLADRLDGAAGNDTLVGSDGHDTLDGGTGADRLEGGAGDDSYFIDAAGDVVTETEGNGFDTLITQVDYVLAADDASVEVLQLAGAATALTGNALANTLVGNALANLLHGGGGDDRLEGGEGNDTLAGDAGNNTLAGGLGDDTYLRDAAGDLVVETTGGGSDTVISSVNYTLAAQVEHLVLAAGASNGGGNALDNTVTGNTANNLLAGAAGHDTLDGGTGADSLYGGLGDDTYLRDAAGDVVVENAGEGSDTVISSVNYTLAAHVERLVLAAGASNGGGNALDNTVTGNTANNLLAGAAGNDTLDGGAGADSLYGGLGNDTYYRDQGGDLITEHAGEGIDTVISSVNHTLAAHVENLVLTGAATNGGGNALANLITGNALNNLLAGADGNDSLDGAEGNDTLYGGSGSNSLSGGLGNDTYYRDSASDQIIENAGEGSDLVYSSVSHTLAANVENLVLTGAATNGGGNALGNLITGNAANNLLSGADGNDTLTGAAGNDTLYGGSGSNTLTGGLGDDTYYRDSASDLIIENAGEGSDTIVSSLNLSLAAHIEHLVLVGAATNGGGNALDNSITGNAANNLLAGAAGHDTLDGGLGADTLIGGAGNDSYLRDNAADLVTEAAGEGLDTVITTVNHTLAANVEQLLLSGAATNGGGNALDNLMSGNALNNVLAGAAGADSLLGGLGNDTLYGGAGSDQFVFDTAPDAATNVDLIADHAAGDLLALDNDVFTALGAPGALSAAQFFSGAGLTGSSSALQGAGLYYDSSAGALYYDADGFGGAAGVKFAVVAGAPAANTLSFTVLD